MSVRLLPERCKAITELCQEILNQKWVTIRKFAKLNGKLVAAELGIEYVPLYYKPLEKLKEQLNIHKGNFDSFMTIPSQIVPTTEWWINNISPSCKLISHGPPPLKWYSILTHPQKHGEHSIKHDIHTWRGVVSRRTKVSHQYFGAQSLSVCLRHDKCKG